MDNKKNGIPKLRFPGFTGAWEQRKLGEVVERRIEKRRQSERYPRLAFASGQGVIPLSERKTNNREQLTKDEFTKKYLVTELDDIVYNPANVKYGAIDRNKYGRGLISPIYVTFTTEEVPGFIERIVKSHDFKQKALRFEEGTVTKRQSVNPEDLVTINILVASQKKEQKKISLFFDNIDTFIALHQRKLEHLQEQKKGLLQKMFPKNGETVPEVRFPGFTDAWEQRKLGEVVKKSTIKNSDLEYSKDDILSVATMSDMNFSREINSTKDYMKTYNKILYGEIAFEGHSSKNYKFGRFVLNDYRNGIVSHIYDIYKITINYDMKFMKEWISLDKVMYKPLVNSTTNARMMNSLQAKNLYKQKVLLPNLQEQKEIGKFLKKVDSLIALHQRKLEHLELMKKGLLQQMFV
ncbi:Type I restriction-modification system, specificity subunit S [Ligilactobacillus salivarius cp400]|uniref:Type I restriction-modification system, specificity subunit S n=1 Tax=Ligilactobacillus salivarius cp400 TaxID=1273133 RepID=V6DI28_9LACO|nr:Type I restriction-modification system, specificity subunit S [Ligilactobacillus salivarius cp400]